LHKADGTVSTTLPITMAAGDVTSVTTAPFLTQPVPAYVVTVTSTSAVGTPFARSTTCSRALPLATCANAAPVLLTKAPGVSGSTTAQITTASASTVFPELAVQLTEVDDVTGVASPFTPTSVGAATVPLFAAPGSTACSTTVAPGYYYDDAVSDAYAVCPMGSFCPGGPATSVPQKEPCPLARPFSAAGSTSADDCSALVPPGYYLNPGQAICPANKYCVGGTAPQDCPLQTTSAEGSKARSDCGECCVCVLTLCVRSSLSHEKQT
jgi:hypothetical protein